MIDIKATLIEFYGIEKENEYLKMYMKLCSSSDSDEYTEKHHILPVHQWKEYKNLKDHSWNCVKLSAKNHCIVHYYFAMFSATRSSWLAVERMTNSKSNQCKTMEMSEIEELSIIYEMSRKKISYKMKGIPRSNETKMKLSLSHKGKY